MDRWLSPVPLKSHVYGAIEIRLLLGITILVMNKSNEIWMWNTLRHSLMINISFHYKAGGIGDAMYVFVDWWITTIKGYGLCCLLKTISSSLSSSWMVGNWGQPVGQMHILFASILNELETDQAFCEQVFAQLITRLTYHTKTL